VDNQRPRTRENLTNSEFRGVHLLAYYTVLERAQFIRVVWRKGGSGEIQKKGKIKDAGLYIGAGEASNPQE